LFLPDKRLGYGERQDSRTVSGEAEVFIHGVCLRGTKNKGVESKAKKVVSGASGIALLLLGLAGGGAALSVMGAAPAHAVATQPLTQMLPSYGKGVLPDPPGSTTYPGLDYSSQTYTVYTYPGSNYTTAANWESALVTGFNPLRGTNGNSGNNGMWVTGYKHLVMLPGDSLIGYGAVASGMDPGSHDTLPDGVLIKDLYSPMNGYFGPHYFNFNLSSFSYTQGCGWRKGRGTNADGSPNYQGLNLCAKDAPELSGNTVLHLWCRHRPFHFQY